MAVNDVRIKIFAASDRKEEVVDCTPEWGVKILVRALSGKERDEYERLLYTPVEGKTEGDNFRSVLVCMCCYDPESKEKLFTSKDVEFVGNKSSEVVDRIFQVAKRLSGMFTKEDTKQEVKN